MATATVTIEKITGESYQCAVDVGDIVQIFKSKIADQVQIPAMCQRLTLMDQDEGRVAQLRELSKEFVGKNLARLLEKVKRPDIQEIKAFMNPPRLCRACLQVVLYLMVGSPMLRERGIRLERKGTLPARTEWDQCVRMMANPDLFIAALQNWASDVFTGDVSEEQVAAAESCIQQLGQDFSERMMMRMSALCGVLVVWVSQALKFYRQDYPRFISSAPASYVEMEDLAPASVYFEDLSVSYKVSVVSDLEPVWAVLANSFPPPEAIDALGVLGSKCAERAVPVLAKFLDRDKEEFRQRAAEALRQAFVSADEVMRKSACELLLEALEPFGRQDGRGPPRQEALQALASLGPENLQVLERIISALNTSFRPGDRGEALEHFKRLESNFEANEVMERLEGAMFPVHEHVRSLGALLEAFAVCSRRNYISALRCLLRHLEPKDLALSAAAAGAAKRAQKGEEGAVDGVAETEVKLVAALKAALQLKGPHVALVARHLPTLEPASYSEAVAALCQQLQRNVDHQDAIESLCVAKVGDEDVIRALSSFLQKGRAVLRKEGHSRLKAAWEELKRVTVDTEVLGRASADVMFALCSRLAETGERVSCGKDLVAMAADGVEERAFAALAHGFCLSLPEQRKSCMNIYKRMATARKGDEDQRARAIQVLLKVAVDEDSFQWTKVSALTVLGDLQKEDLQEEVVAGLLKLSELTDVALRCAAVRCLRPRSEAQVLALEKALQDTDVSVRLAALQSLGQDNSFREVYFRCLQDEASEVVQKALEPMENAPNAEELGRHLLPLLHHGDWQVRAAVARQLGSLGVASASVRAEALRALEANDLWKEMHPEVLKSREKARQQLQ